jgi:two-component system CheB/CheR fusion protein
VSSIERDVQDREGRWYSLRIRPYKNIDNKIDGAVLALFNIDPLKKSEERARVAREYVDGILEATAQPFVVVEPDLRIRSANNAFCRLFSVAPADIEGLPLQEVGGGRWNLEPLRTVMGGGAADALNFENVQVEYAPADAGSLTLALTGGRLPWQDSASEPNLLLLAITDGASTTRPR